METTAQQPRIAEFISRRHSPYAFSDRPVEESTLAVLFEAARWAFSSMNEQPWRYVVATKEDPEAFARMVGILMPGNVAWAKDVPVLILSVAKAVFTHNGAVNAAALHDLGAANASLALQAADMGLVTHPMGGFYGDKAREAFAIPDGYQPVAVIAVGYPGDPESLPEPFRGRQLAPRTRRPQEEFVFRGTWRPPAG